MLQWRCFVNLKRGPMIGLALIQQTIQTLDQEIEEKQQEKQTLLSLDAEINPFLSKIKELCERIPTHQDKILAIVANELGLQSKLGIVSDKPEQIYSKRTVRKKPCPFEKGDRVRVINDSGYGIPDLLGTEFAIESILPRGLGWQIVDSEDNVYRSGDLEKIDIMVEESDAEASDAEPQKNSADNNPQEESAEQKSVEASNADPQGNSADNEPQEEPAEAIDADPQQKSADNEPQEEPTEAIDAEPLAAATETEEKPQGELVAVDETEEEPAEAINTEPQEQPTEEQPTEEQPTEEQPTEEQPQEEPVEESDADPQEEPAEAIDNEQPQEESDEKALIMKALEKLHQAKSLPNWLAARLHEDKIAIVANGNRLKGFISLKDNSFVIGSELEYEEHLEDIKTILSEIAPIWAKKPEQPMVNGLNLGKGIKKDFKALDHKDLMANKIDFEKYSKPECEEFARIIGIEPKGTRKQIGNQICEYYQNAFEKKNATN